MAKNLFKPNKRALLVGVNEYPKLPAELQLKGCANDVAVVKDVLQSLGFASHNIKVLLNGEATRAAILAGMEELVADCQDGDVVVFHFSGHGSATPSIKANKTSGYRESILPSDTGRKSLGFPVQSENLDITNTEIHEWLSRLTRKTRHISLIFDSCHSGSITRVRDDSEKGTRVRWVPPDPLPDGALHSDLGSDTRDANAAKGSGWLPPSDSYVLLAACAANQSAYELDNEEGNTRSRHGAFTFYLSKEILQPGWRYTYRDIWERVSLKVANQFMGKQTPQLEGARDRLLFDVDDFIPMNYLLVSERKGAEVTLHGGAIHGLTEGSRWEIYPPGTRKVSAVEERQGVVKVTAVGMIAATAEVVRESRPNLIEAGGRAVEVLHADAKVRLPVRLTPVPAGYEECLTELKEELLKSKLLEITKTPFVGVEISLLLPGLLGSQILETSNHEPLREPNWIVLGQADKRLWMPPYPVGVAKSARRIRDNLETVWRYKQLSELSNGTSSLGGKVKFVLLQKDSSGSWCEVGGGNNPRQPVYQAGDQIAFRVINGSSATIYASVLDFGLSKRIDVLFPTNRGSEMIGPRSAGGLLSVGEDVRAPIELFFPRDLTFLENRDSDGKLIGNEMFKLIVTTSPHDLGFLRQSGLRGDKRELRGIKHPLERLAYLATYSGSKREAQQQLSPDDEWLTIEQSFWLKAEQVKTTE